MRVSKLRSLCIVACGYRIRVRFALLGWMWRSKISIRFFVVVGCGCVRRTVDSIARTPLESRSQFRITNISKRNSDSNSNDHNNSNRVTRTSPTTTIPNVCVSVQLKAKVQAVIKALGVPVEACLSCQDDYYRKVRRETKY